MSSKLPKVVEKEIYISTACPSHSYEIIDTIHALDFVSVRDFYSLDPGQIFEGVKKKLRLQASQQNGDAVINCSFKYRTTTFAEEVAGLFSTDYIEKEVVEIFSTGTVIRAI